MTVAELREILADLPDHMPVIMSIDPEGNAYNSLSEAEPSKVKPDGHQWDVIHADDIESYAATNYEGISDGLVLWP